ncbi:MAG: isochorismatase family protein [Sedimentisphaerales bacterium]|nr:isochorismatase family protein [Sedimentisphaerales bacterium]
MKRKYFDINDLTKQGPVLRGEAGATGGRFRFDLGRAGLLLLDMQRYFLDREGHAWIPSGEVILPGLVRLAEVFGRAGRPVVLTRHLNNEADAGMMGCWWRGLIERERPDSEVVGQLADYAARGEARLLEKEQYDAFYETDLEQWLRAQGVEQIVIGGVMANLCCETTARSGFVRGFEVFFLVDGTAAYNRELHLATLRNIGFGFGELVTVAEVAAMMGDDR